MGCCVSTDDKKTLQNTTTHQFPCISKSPPRAEEEAVKEVLSETPKPKPKPRSRPESPRRVVGVIDENEDELMKSKVLLVTPTKKAFPERKVAQRYLDPCTPDEISEASEMCSFSESISAATIKEEEDQHQQNHTMYCSKETVASSTTTPTSSGEVRQRVYRSQLYNHNNNNNGHNTNYNQYQPQPQQPHYKNQGRSPARRLPEPSPPRRRNPSPGGGPRKEFVGDNSGRRSQSPGMRGNVGRSPSSRRTGPSPGRVRMVHSPENEKKVEENEEEVGLRRESEEWQGPQESLENPLVSLECFIFL